MNDRTPSPNGKMAFESVPGSQGLFVTDLDGTLLRSDQRVASDDLKALERLGRRGITRAVATGRSLFSYQRAGIQLPVEYLIFSTGTGIFSFAHNDIVHQNRLNPGEVARAAAVFEKIGVDYSIHEPVPRNHCFAYRCNHKSNPDFDHRLQLYQGFCRKLDTVPESFGPAAQLLAVLPSEQTEMLLPLIRRQMTGLNVIRATSPLDGRSTWVEIFPSTVSKSLTAAWLADRLKIGREKSMCIGNDYNDQDMLEWAGVSYVVDNAPDTLKARFDAVASNNGCGVAEAIDRWLGHLRCTCGDLSGL
jgi:Cof subfamily protein (haloacid dehalogenase superfamily)